MRFLVATLACIGLPALLAAQSLATSQALADSARVEIERASMVGDVARLRALRERLDGAITASPDDAMLLHYRGYAEYRLANLAPAEAAGLLDAAGESLRRSASQRPLPESYMLLAVVRSRLATIDSSRREALQGEADGAMQRALRGAGSENPRVLLLSAVSALYTPPSLGGGPAAAEQILNHAVRQFAGDHPPTPLPAWGRAEAFAWLGQVYERTGRPREALAAYNRALRLEPHFAWVRDGLLPALQPTPRVGAARRRVTEESPPLPSSPSTRRSRPSSPRS